MAMSSFAQAKSSPLILFFVLILIWTFRYQNIIDSTSFSAPSFSASWTGMFEAEIVDEADAALIELCNQAQWTQGLWLSCHSRCGPNQTSVCGGLNNARNRVQTCLRLAIDLGAGIKFPRVTERSDTNLLDVGAGAGSMAVCPSAWWDMDGLTTTMGALCPQMHISPCNESPSEISRVASSSAAGFDRTHLEAPYHITTFRDLVVTDLKKQGLSLASVTPATPLLVRFGDSFLGWDYRASDELTTQRKALFRALNFNSTLSALGDAILDSPPLQEEGGFFAVHLRGEGDWPAGWGTPQRQMEVHAAEIVRSAADAEAQGEPVAPQVYVSCGDQGMIQRFREMLAVYGFEVHDKWSLLADRPAMLEDINARLSFDQKGAVEYNVLVAARYFQGISMSTFSTLVVYARTMDRPEDFYQTQIFSNTEIVGGERTYPEPLIMKGDEFTKLFVVNGLDYMDMFP